MYNGHNHLNIEVYSNLEIVMIEIVRLDIVLILVAT